MNDTLEALKLIHQSLAETNRRLDGVERAVVELSEQINGEQEITRQRLDAYNRRIELLERAAG